MNKFDLEKYKSESHFSDRKPQPENGFVLPEGYFASLKDKILSSRYRLPELGKMFFRIPENYFITLTEQIWAKIASLDPEQNTPVIPVYSNAKPAGLKLTYLQIAATLLLISGLALGIWNGYFHSEPPVQLAFSRSEIIHYLNSNVGQSEVQDMLETATENSLPVSTLKLDSDMKKAILRERSDLESALIE